MMDCMKETDGDEAKADAMLKRKLDLENAAATPAAKKAHVDADAAKETQRKADEALKKSQAAALAEQAAARAEQERRAAAAAEGEKMMVAVRTWDNPTLKRFIALLPKEHFDAKQGKKDAMVECIKFNIKAGLLGRRTARGWDYTPGDEIRRFVVDAFEQTAAASASTAAKKKMDPGTRALEARLAVLDKAQVVDLVLALVDANAALRPAVEALLPKADCGPVIADLEAKVRAISKALPNSRYGSNTDKYGYGRASAANQAAKKAFLEAVASYRKSKQWAAAAAFADRATPVAARMADFDHAPHNAARNAVAEALLKLKTEARAHL